MKLRIYNVRLAFPALFEAKAVQGEGEPAFSAVFLLPPAHRDVATIRAALRQVAEEKWKGKAAEILDKLAKADKTCLHDGDNKSEYDGFPGNLYIRARSKVRPLTLDQSRSPLTAADGKPYAGCYVNAVLELWPQDNNYGKRINAQLKGVQFVRDGDAFSGGAPASQNDFDDITDTGDEPTTVDLTT